MVSVGVFGLKGEDWGGRGCVEVDHSLHGQRPVDEVGRLVVDVLDSDDHPLVVGVRHSGFPFCDKQKIEEMRQTVRD